MLATIKIQKWINFSTVVVLRCINLYCTIICKLFGVKIIVRSNASPQGYYKNNIKLFLYKYFFSFADQIIVNSYDFKKQFKKFFLLNAKCIYNPLNKKYILKESKAKLNFPFFCLWLLVSKAQRYLIEYHSRPILGLRSG